ncbi:MAG: hypothetical protein IKN12_02635 [Selenomonadaceae bacterium]|nr:hypothetical protein [Selenomonadaceae bacterium]
MNFMNTREYQDIVAEEDMIDEIIEDEPTSPFYDGAPDFSKNVWDGEKLVTEAEYNASIDDETEG